MIYVQDAYMEIAKVLRILQQKLNMPMNLLEWMRLFVKFRGSEL